VNELYKEQQLAKKLYRDIVQGYSVFNKDNSYVYFKHLTEIEFAESQDQYIRLLSDSKKRGLLDEKDKIKILCEQGIWSNEKENEIKLYNKEIIGDEATLNKLIIKSQINQIKNSIKIKQQKLDEINKERDELLGLTAERYAFKKSNEFLLYLTLYRDSSFKNRIFEEDKDDFFDIEDRELMEYINIYKEFNTMFDAENIKKIAVCSFFMNNFFHCEDNPYYFYGKPIVELTQNQMQLFYIAKNYKYLLTKNGENPPNNIESLNDLISWYENRSSASNLKDKIAEDKLGQTYIGASKEELKAMTASSKEEVLDLNQESKKLGGDLSFEQILKIHGI